MDKLWRLKCERGQSLVEMAIIAPILVFLLIGVFEVGYALRSYLVLTNANREAARFAVRQDYLDFSSDNIGYERVWTHTVESISDQIPFSDSGDMIISYITVEATCTGPFTITTPLNVPTYTWRYPPTTTRQTRLDYTRLGQDALLSQRNYVCGLSGGRVPLDNRMVAVEVWMKHYQLFGFPIIANPYTNPLELYAYTIFRKAPDSRK